MDNDQQVSSDHPMVERPSIFSQGNRHQILVAHLISLMNSAHLLISHWISHFLGKLVLNETQPHHHFPMKSARQPMSCKATMFRRTIDSFSGCRPKASRRTLTVDGVAEVQPMCARTKHGLGTERNVQRCKDEKSSENWVPHVLLLYHHPMSSR